MRIYDAGELATILESPVALKAPLTNELEQALVAAIESPFPFAHYLASRFVAQREEGKLAGPLTKSLPAYVAAADTVGFYWACDALGRLRAKEAVATLSQYAVEKSFDRTYGPTGMAFGFAAARALGMIADDMQRDEVTRLLSSDNVWLRAGVLDGLVERREPAIAAELKQLLARSPSAILEAEARFGLRIIDRNPE
jgi:hypothetical protein